MSTRNPSHPEMPAASFSRTIAALLYTVLLFSSACNSGGRENARSVEIDLGKSAPDRLLAFYFGGYVSEAGADPFLSGMLEKKDGRYYLNKDHLADEVRAALNDHDRNGIIDWDELEPFLQETYYMVRPAPPTLAELRRRARYDDTEGWFEIGVDGVMTTARRRVYVERNAIREALAGFERHEGRLLYPGDTYFIGEHVRDDRTVETTVMHKRGDGFWDFFVYDEAGDLTGSTKTPPRELFVPTRCVGCHFGDKKFEPETSFPFPATPGPHGPRGVHARFEAADSNIVHLLDEHNKRSDTVLGLYATIYLGQLRAERRAGATVEEPDRRILEIFE